MLARSGQCGLEPRLVEVETGSERCASLSMMAGQGWAVLPERASNRFATCRETITIERREGCFCDRMIIRIRLQAGRFEGGYLLSKERR